MRLRLGKGDAAINLAQRDFAIQNGQRNHSFRAAEHAQEPTVVSASVQIGAVEILIDYKISFNRGYIEIETELVDAVDMTLMKAM